MQKIADLFPVLPEELRQKRLEWPHGKINAVLDTDLSNEIDDLFALGLAILTPEKINLQAVTAVPFFNNRSTSPQDGMEKSYQEILYSLELLKKQKEHFVFRGSENYLPDPFTPVESPAARRIVELAQEAAIKDEVLYIFAIGAITNVASALLLSPEIIKNTVIIWLGGHNLHTRVNNEFNFYQDIAASQVIFDSGVPLVWVPCAGVAELLITSLPQIETNCSNGTEFGKYLQKRSRDYMKNDPQALKVIWDISTVLYILRPDLVTSRLISAPIPADDGAWTEEENRHPIRQVTYLNRPGSFQYLYEILQKAPQ